MIPLLIELPATEPDLADSDPDETHIACCDEYRALCGVRLEGDYEDDDYPEELICEVCVNRNRLGLPCGARFCRLRQWWRDRRPGGGKGGA